MQSIYLGLPSWSALNHVLNADISEPALLLIKGTPGFPFPFKPDRQTSKAEK